MRVVDHLERRGHTALVVAPGPGPARCGRLATTPVVRVPSVALPAYRTLPVGIPTAGVRRALEAFEPDVVHLAAPLVLGEAAVRAAATMAIPAVAVYQTDISGFARRYKLGAASGTVWRWLRRVHNAAELTLAPSSAAEWDLRRNGIERVERWGRGVDLEQWAPSRRDESLRRTLLGPVGRVLVGYSGRLAAEKRVGMLAAAADIPGVRLVVVGDGPARSRLQRELPTASFLGFRSGTELAAIVASLDVFVHTGPHETFCQAIQEAMAAGVPVVAPASGGPLDLVAHGRTGWLYPPDSPDLLRQAVTSLAGDPGLRASMGVAAAAQVGDRSWEAVGDELLGHYRRAVGATLSGRQPAAA
jgi:phosphatidylinositol alpha 1,6-mannosyltransferase